MFRACLFGCATALLVACPSPRGAHYATRDPRDDSALRIRIAKLELARAGGVAELALLARDGDSVTSLLALRGLGRIDTTDAARALPPPRSGSRARSRSPTSTSARAEPTRCSRRIVPTSITV